MNQKDLDINLQKLCQEVDDRINELLDKYCVEPVSLAWKVTITINDGYTEESYTLNKDGMYMGDLTPIVVKGG